jgi:hypothetical protein
MHKQILAYNNNMFKQKQQLFIKMLRENSMRLLMPKKVIHSLKKTDLTIIANYFTIYNKIIKNARTLKTQLEEMESWGILIDSYYLWKRSVFENYNQINIIIDKLFYYMENASIYTKMLMRHNGVKRETMTRFINTRNKGNKYVYYTKVEGEEYDTTVEHIADLLPRCMVIKNTVNKSIADLYEPPHKLDELNF